MGFELPDHRVLGTLGNGAGSALYKTRCLRTGELFAVKHVLVNTPDDHKHIEQLKAEHAAGSAIHHPAIRKVYELRYVRRHFRVRSAMLFMEYVAGIPMNDRHFSRSLHDLLAIFIKVAAGLEAMHRTGFVHADLKPGNILVASGDDVKLIDFGQSCPIHTSKSRIQGTIDYMAPEQVARSILDRRTDVFGLGATLHRVVTGRPIATDMNQNLTLQAQGLLGKRVAELAQPTDTAMPPAVARLIESCCQPDPVARLPDMHTFMERAALARTVLLKRHRSSRSSRISRSHRRRSGGESA